MYNTNKSWKENLISGPQIHPSEEDFFTLACLKPQSIDFLGYNVSSDIGIASGPLLDSKWVITAADFGFDILTYKTIRSYYHEGHNVPNIIKLEDGSFTNYFGMPSMDKEFLKKDIQFANEYLDKKGKILIVSITGDNIQDYVDTAKFAVNECKAKILEVNLSCPNVNKKLIYKDPQAMSDIISEIKKYVNVPIIIKVGWYDDESVLKEVLITASDLGINAISGINGIPRKVSGLREHEIITGICGEPIFSYTVIFVSTANKIITDLNLPIKLIAVGGVVTNTQIDILKNMGADYVQIASGFIMGNHRLALEYKINEQKVH